LDPVRDVSHTVDARVRRIPATENENPEPDSSDEPDGDQPDSPAAANLSPGPAAVRPCPPRLREGGRRVDEPPFLGDQPLQRRAPRDMDQSDESPDARLPA